MPHAEKCVASKGVASKAPKWDGSRSLRPPPPPLATPPEQRLPELLARAGRGDGVNGFTHTPPAENLDICCRSVSSLKVFLRNKMLRTRLTWMIGRVFLMYVCCMYVFHIHTVSLSIYLLQIHTSQPEVRQTWRRPSSQRSREVIFTFPILDSLP